MQQAIPYSSSGTRAWGPPLPSSPAATSSRSGGREELKKVIAETPVVVVGRRGCCMCHVIKRLLQGLGVNPAVFEVNQQDDDNEEEEQYPAVYIGGRLVGGLDRLMAVHISGELIPTLKKAGALWL